MTTLAFFFSGWSLAALGATWSTPSQRRAFALAFVTIVALAVVSPPSLAAFAFLAIGAHLTIGRASAAKVALLAFGTLCAWRLLPGLRGVHAIGLTYCVLRVVGLAIDVGVRGVVAPTFVELVAYLGFFPALLAGPVHRFEDFRRDLRRHRWDRDRASEALERLLYGTFKVAVLANHVLLVRIAPSLAAFRLRHVALGEYLDCVRYGANLYLQLSGYTDLAIGLGLLLGVRLPENFQRPYFARDIVDFWGRWHISVSSWFRDNVFSPVSARTRSAPFAAIATMVAIGLWHELSPRYVAWGLFHGVSIVVFRVWRGRATSLAVGVGPLRRLAGTALTLHVVTLSFAITKSATLTDAARSLATIFCLRQG